MNAPTRLSISHQRFSEIAADVRIDPALGEELWNRLGAVAPRPHFGMANVAYYGGALTVISSMTWFITLEWDKTDGLFKFFAALIYATVFTIAGLVLRRAHDLRVPSGLLFTAAVSMTPLAVFGLQSATNGWLQGDPGSYSGFYAWIKGSWLPMELATVAVGLIVLRFVRFPFLVAPIGFATWFISMDLASFVFPASRTDLDFHDRAIVSIVVGALTIVAAFLVDRVTREDYAFWLYLFGSLSFWGGIWTFTDWTSESAQFGNFLIALGFLVASVVLGRRALTVFGCLGTFSYLGDLAWDFRDSLSFPVMLTLVGLAVIGLGIAFQRNLPRLEAAANAIVPASIRKLVPRSRVA